MTPFEKAYSEVAGLVHEFEANEDHYLSPKYQEAEVREDFLNKFWTSLGWDVRHVTQTNPREQEVKVEKNPDSSASSRRADYAFYLKPDYRSPVFFCEAKKPSRKLSDPEFYFQLVRYGRGASTPVGVLTDFEEFHIIDCRYEPHIEKSYPSAQIKAFHYKDYLDRDNFGFIYWLFSREAVEAGKLKKFAKGLPKQRGAGKAKLTAEEAKPVDEAFLTKLEEYRLTLAKAFKKADESLTAEDLTEATQKVIDRLVFIRFLEDKNIESDYIVDQIAGKTLTPTLSLSTGRGSGTPRPVVRERGRGEGGAWTSFLAWSKELDVKYNGVVFKPHDIDKPSFIAPDDNIFADLCTDISHRYSKYLFSYIPIEILGSIYERFLGKVITATAKRADIEYKPEVRKAGGVYYTPKYIVDYIVENTVGKILSGESEKAVSSGADSQSASQNAASSGMDSQSVKGARGKTDGLRVRPTGEANSLTPKEISKLRFADIACGSGSFLIAVYDRILHHVEQWYNGHPDEARKAGCTEIDKGIFALSLKQKQQILLDNIFGVDIDHQAVEVAQLSLFLKLLESESGATAGQLSFEKTKILPDLSKNIQCGNSLVEYDIEAPLSLYSGRGAGGEGLTPEEFEKIKPFDFKSSFKQVMDRGGFDAIVGNPPYGAELPEMVYRYVQKNYEIGNTDTAALMMVKANRLLKSNGYVGYIIPKSFTYASNWEKTRALLIDDIQQIVDCSKVWMEVKYEMCIYLAKKDSHSKFFLSGIRLKESVIQIGEIEKILCNEFGFILNGVTTTEIELARKTRSALKYFNDVIENQRGGIFQKYISAKGDYDVLGGAQIGRYKMSSEIKGMVEKKYITEQKCFVKEKSILTQRIVAHIANPFPHIKITALPSDLFNPKQMPVIVDTINQLTNKSNYSHYYLLALLNSNLMSWYAYRFVFGNAIRTMQFDNPTTSKLPIPNLDLANLADKQRHDALVSLVEQMLEAKKRLAAASRETERDQLTRKCEYLDNEIDKLVYGLYGLSEGEIKIVEGGG